jgi:anti-sigma factor RsiW
MECSSPPPLSDDAISAILDGLADPSALSHVSACPSCAARLRDAQQAEGRLHARLRRFDCPPPDRLGEYHFGMLPADAERATRAHLAACLRCQEELEQLRVFMLADDPEALPANPPAPRALRPERRAPRLRELVARLLPAPALALRGAASRTRAYEAGDVTVLVTVEPSSGGALLVGQLLADDEEQWAGALIEARQGGALVATAALDELAMFRVGPLVAAPADLRIVSPAGASIAIVGVEFDG